MRDALMVALDVDGLIHRDGAVVTVQLRKLRLHGTAQPERARAGSQRHEDEYREADAQQAEDPAALPSQNGLSIRRIHDAVLGLPGAGRGPGTQTPYRSCWERPATRRLDSAGRPGNPNHSL